MATSQLEAENIRLESELNIARLTIKGMMSSISAASLTSASVTAERYEQERQELLAYIKQLELRIADLEAAARYDVHLIEAGGVDNGN